MPSTFWTNTIWYILLGITTIIKLILIFTKVKDRKLKLALYLTITGLTFTFEMMIFAGLKAYQYFPKFFPKSLYDDSNMTWMTFIGLLFLFWVTPKIYRQNISKNIGNIWRSIYIFFGLQTFHNNMMWAFRPLRLHTFGKVFLPVESKTIITVGAYELVLGSTIMALYFSKIKWWWKAMINYMTQKNRDIFGKNENAVLLLPIPVILMLPGN